MKTNRIKQLRTERNLTLTKLSELVNIPQPTLSRYETGFVKNGKNEVWEKLANFFNVSIGFIQGTSKVKHEDTSYNRDTSIFSHWATQEDLINIFDETFPDRQEADREVKLSFGEIIYTTHSRIRKVMPPMYSERDLNRYRVVYNIVIEALTLIDISITDNELSNFIFNMRGWVDILEEDELNKKNRNTLKVL